MGELDARTTRPEHALTPRLSAPLAKHHIQLPPPMLGHGDQLPLHLRRQGAQHRFVGWMNPQSRSRLQQPRHKRRNLRPCEISLPLKCRKRPSASFASNRMSVVVQRAYPNPGVQRLQRQIEILVGLQFNNRQPSVAVERERVQHASIPHRERRHLRVEQVPAQSR
jgi:hypothetical protein